ncbi:MULTISPECIES: ABC transporter substrate-binding protein [unclassified Mesorhizobium]|uniref:ABC transporter substrate-binding protein n=1 Tax=unclassified Mesorhizobium TaxID=325217 RepID=UPI00112D7714|nr:MULTISPECIES: ABC transporter substrate-binding protein [unclassified Mesorhizobium]MBZ9696940.1 ABC transporter substrate-binding protein [Mesorhizobium sp. CO1-1-9]TPK09070.1 transporter substrate-binding domain-containing protein [Mesorhizobium sp. B2-5-7]
MTLNLAGQFRALVMAAAIGLATAPVAHAADAAIPTTPEAGSFKIGIEPWLGYGQWHVAEAKGLFKTNGLSDVQIVNFAEDKDINAALASGQLDAANIATHTAMGMVAAGLPVKIVLLLDVSMTADAIVAGKDVTSIADLKGKQVAFEEGTTSDILLKYALARNGMSVADIQPVPMPAADAGGALIAGQVPVAVTYEPYLTVAMAQNKDVKLLFTAGEDPGLISDVLVVRDEVIKSRPGQVLAMIKSWDAALKDYNADTPGGRAIIAKAVGSDVKDLNTAFDGVRYYSLAENKTALTGEFTTKTFADVEGAAKNAKLLQADVTPEQMIDPSFVKAAQ